MSCTFSNKGRYANMMGTRTLKNLGIKVKTCCTFKLTTENRTSGLNKTL